MTTTRATTAFDRLRGAAVGALLLGCSTTGGTSGETHFLCSATPDCAVHGAAYACVDGVCRRSASGAGQSTGTIASASTRATGALTFVVSAEPGRPCSHTSTWLSMPPGPDGGTLPHEVACGDPAGGGCKADSRVMTDGEPGTSLSCSVAPQGEDFAVSVSLSYDGSATRDPSFQFQANGVVAPGGGTLAITESNSVAQWGTNDERCAVELGSNLGYVAGGKIWSDLHCYNFGDPNDPETTGCVLAGWFRFENCLR